MITESHPAPEAAGPKPNVTSTAQGPQGQVCYTTSTAPGEPFDSPKLRLVALLLCWIFGVWGVHRFYAGKIGTGLLQLLTFGGFGIWALIDLIVIAAGHSKTAAAGGS